ncbi:hypothetical protein BJX68DRAFT_167531 [Aspergillus pseudodeflectus]|uniref:G domain-containing protein n=1 Tax=Aspergillus pseudodeflectus TaxID=176178 RepID=A0ABR4JR52_9EURO
MEYRKSMNTKRTERCLEKIKAYKRGGARTILLFGKPGVGKSSLAEHITGTSGLSGDSETGTERCQIIDTQINETEHFVVDTPGFEDEGGAWATFCEIARLLDQIREHAVIVAIFFVTPIYIFKRRPDPFEEKIYIWLFGMNGRPFMKYVTFVTTFWEAHNPAQLKKYNGFLVRRKEQEWAGFIAHGARTYQFGKVYSAGVEIEETLHWDTDAERLAAQSREMVRVYCPEIPTVQPLILHELNMEMALELTAAGQVFWPAGDGGTNDQGPSRAQSTASSGGSGRSRSTESPRSGAQESTTPTSPPTTESTGNDPAAPDGWARLGEFAWDVTKRYGPQLVEHVLKRQFGGAGAIVGGGGGGFASSMQSMSAKGFDIKSATDTAKFFGLASDMGSRGQYFATWGGVGDYIGSAEQNDWLRHQMWRRFSR